MFKRLTPYKYSKIITSVLLAGMVSLAHASKQDEQINEVISAIDNKTTNNQDGSESRSTPNSFVALDFSLQTAESWDAKDQPKNMITNCIDGKVITGFEAIDVTIQTFANSYFSEAVVYFSDSNTGDDGIRYVIGSGNETSGTATFNSNGVLDISDTGNEDVTSLNDDKFFIQFYEQVDDSQNVIDALFTSGVLKVWGTDLVATSGCPFIEGMVIDEPADLSVEYSLNEAANNINHVGGTLIFDIVVANSGDGDATNVAIESDLSTNLRFNEMSCDDGTNVDSMIASIAVQDIAAGSTLSCTLDAVIIDYGAINTSISVASDDDDDLNNNSATLVINGAVRVIPVNNFMALLLLVFGMMLFARKLFAKD